MAKHSKINRDDSMAFGKQIQEPISHSPKVEVDPRDVKLREAMPKPVKKDEDGAIFTGAGSIIITKKNGKSYPVRFEPGTLIASVSDPEVIAELRKRGYREV